jgi:tetratricopeptide (TPR) repeat protein
MKRFSHLNILILFIDMCLVGMLLGNITLSSASNEEHIKKIGFIQPVDKKTDSLMSRDNAFLLADRIKELKPLKEKPGQLLQSKIPDNALIVMDSRNVKGRKHIKHSKANVFFNKAANLFEQGLKLSASGQYIEAIQAFSSCIKAMPNDANAYYNRALVYQYTGEHSMAISDYTRTIELMRDSADAYYNQGIAYHYIGDFVLAIKEYSNAIEQNPKDANAYWNRGIAFSDRNEYVEAASDYCRAIDLDPRVTVNDRLSSESLLKDNAQVVNK